METNRPRMHEVTQASVEQYIASGSQNILLAGKFGSGKREVAHYIASSLLASGNTAIQDHPYVKIVDGASGSIGIESIREIQKFLQHKVPGAAAKINRVVMVLQAESMTPEAQNAFLKTLEEPPVSTAIIMTVSDKQQLLPTVLSRVHIIAVRPLTRKQLQVSLATNDQDTARIYALSGGRAQLAHTLSAGDESHIYTQAAATARAILTGSSFERMTLIEGLTKNSNLLNAVLDVLCNMSRAGIVSAKQSDRWLTIYQRATDAEESITRGASPKLVLSHLMLSI